MMIPRITRGGNRAGVLLAALRRYTRIMDRVAGSTSFSISSPTTRQRKLVRRDDADDGAGKKRRESRRPTDVCNTPRLLACELLAKLNQSRIALRICRLRAIIIGSVRRTDSSKWLTSVGFPRGLAHPYSRV